MSTDYHPAEIERVLGAVCSLQQLRRLSLPKNLTRHLNTIYSDRNTRPAAILKWPPNLSYLTIAGASTDVLEAWNALLESFPPSLETLVLHQTPFFIFADMAVTAPQIRTFEFGCGSNATYPHHTAAPRLLSVFTIFPNLQKITLPSSAVLSNAMDFDFHSEKMRARLNTIEVMIIKTVLSESPSAVDERQMDSATLLIMLGILAHAPRLRRIELGRSRIIFTSLGETELFKSFSDRIKGHAPAELRDSSGIFLVDDDVTDDVSQFGPEIWLSRGPRAPDAS
jgi:hypothetical protein